MLIYQAVPEYQWEQAVPWAVASQAVTSLVVDTWVVVGHSLAATSQVVATSQAVVAQVAGGSTLAILAIAAMDIIVEDMAVDHKLAAEQVMSQRQQQHVYQYGAYLHVSPFFFCA